MQKLETAAGLANWTVPGSRGESQSPTETEAWREVTSSLRPRRVCLHFLGKLTLVFPPPTSTPNSTPYSSTDKFLFLSKNLWEEHSPPFSLQINGSYQIYLKATNLETKQNKQKQNTGIWERLSKGQGIFWNFCFACGLWTRQQSSFHLMLVALGLETAALPGDLAVTGQLIIILPVSGDPMATKASTGTRYETDA